MRLKRVQVRTSNTADGAISRRARGWQLISSSTLAVFALGYVVTGIATGAYTAEALPVDSASRALAVPGTGIVDPAVMPFLNPKLLKAVPVGPGPVSEPVRKVLTSARMMTVLDASGIPVVALEAYQHAATVLGVSDPACHLPWQLLAAIGRVESDDGQFGGSVLLPDGYGTRPIYGIPLDGRPGVALIRNTDQNEVNLDGGSTFARAVGPMQFLPSTWEEYGADGNGDGKKDPNNIFDAALAAAGYLCAGGGDMAIPAQEAAAVLRYNDADEYVRVVLALAASYERGDYPAAPPAGPAGTVSNGGGSAPGKPSSPHPGAPAPTKTALPGATPAPAQTPAQRPATPSSPAAAATPPVSPEATPAAGPSSQPTTAPASPAPTNTTQPSQAPVPSATPAVPAGQTVDVGWAPATRQVVVELLTAPKAAPTAPARPAHPEPRPAQASTQPARKTTAPGHS